MVATLFRKGAPASAPLTDGDNEGLSLTDLIVLFARVALREMSDVTTDFDLRGGGSPKNQDSGLVCVAKTTGGPG